MDNFDLVKEAVVEQNSPLEAASTPIPTSQPPPSVSPSSGFQNINNRLASYIERVKYLENENEQLNVQLQTSTDQLRHETTNIKLTYDNELSDVRKILNENARETAKLKIETKRLCEENEAIEKKFEKKCNEAHISDHCASLSESKYNEINNKYNGAIGKLKVAVDNAKDLECNLKKLLQQFQQCRKSLEEETLDRVALQNTVQTLRKELELRSRYQVGISEINSHLATKYETELQQLLQKHRDQYEALSDTQIKNIQNAVQRDKLALSVGINPRIAELEEMNSSLNHRSRCLQLMLDGERARKAENEAEINRVREKLALQLRGCQHLMDIIRSVELATNAYSKLLSGGEQRLNITASRVSQSFSNSVRGTSCRLTPGHKRKRTLLDETDEHIEQTSDVEENKTSSDKSVVERKRNDNMYGKVYYYYNRASEWYKWYTQENT